MIPILDLKRQYLSLENEIDQAVKEVLLSTYFINGKAVTELEENIARYCLSNYAVGLNSGTDALLLALRSLGIGPGDEVITTPFTFIATTEVIELIRAKPVFSDIIPGTFNIDPEQIEAKITPKTRAIMPVHLFGQVCEMAEILSIAQKYNLKVIEDCAQALGAVYSKEKKAGTMGDIGCFSFFPSKNLGACGDAGMLISDNAALAEKARVLGQHGAKVKYYHEEVGINSRLDTIQAAILNVKLPFLDKWTQQRRAIAFKYTEAFNGLESVRAPQDSKNSWSVYHQYTIRVLNNQRGALQQKLKDKGIQTMIYYPVPLHRQKIHAHLGYREGDFPHSEQAAKEVLSLPIFPELTGEEQDFIIGAVKEAL
jgi:dTDP-4-amino-4,6-dideoxygalactose transaminase